MVTYPQSGIFYFFGLFMIICLSSCEKEELCEDNLFEVQGLELIPRKADKPTSDHALWRNEEQLSVNSLRLKIDMFKPIQYTARYAMTRECRPQFINTNPAVDLILVSDKNYNANFPAGSNLLDNASFILFDSNKISKDKFLEAHFNLTDWNYYYIVFNKTPAQKTIHTLVLMAKLENGTVLKSNPVNVLLGP